MNIQDRTIQNRALVFFVLAITIIQSTLLGEVTLEVDATYIDKFSPNKNFGTDTNIQLSSNTGNIHYGYLRWTLPTLPVDYTATEAVIRLRKAFSFNNGTKAINLYQISGAWSEVSLNWSNQPPISTGGALATVNFSDTDTVGKTYSFSTSQLAGLVQRWVNGAEPNYGLQIRQTSTTGVVAFSTDDGGETVRPVLDVSWVGQSQSFVAEEATYTAKLYPSANYEAATHMDATSHPNVLYGFVRWNLSSIPPDAVIVSANVRLCRAYGFHNTSTQIQVLQPAASWVEGNGGTDGVPSGEITWANQPGLTSSLVVASTTAYDSDPSGTTYELRSAQLTSLVQSWITGAIPNVGVRVQQSSTGVVAFYSDDEPNLSSRPELEISPVAFTVPSPETCEVTVDTWNSLGPVNRKVMGVCLMNPNPSFGGPEFIDAFAGIFDGVGGRAWASTLDDSWWNGFWPFVTGVGLGDVNALVSNGILSSTASYTSSTVNNLNSNQLPSYYATIANTVINGYHRSISGWEIWNEPEVPQNGKWPAADFSRYVSDCAFALRGKVPTLRIGAPLYEADQSWNSQFLSAIAAQPPDRQINFAVTHPYDFFWQQAQKNMGSYYARVSGSEPLRLWRLRPKIELIKQIRPAWGLVASEWNTHPITYNPPYNVTTDMAAAIHASAMLGVFWEEGLESAQYFQFTRGAEGHFAMIQGTPQDLLPTGFVFQLYGEYFRGNRLEADVVAPSYSYQHPYYDESVSIPLIFSHAAYNASNQNLCLILSNRHIDAPAEVLVNLKHL